MTHRLVTFTAPLVAITALALLVVFMAATDARLEQLEGPMPTYTGPKELNA